MAFDPVLLSRIQFAFVVSFHIIFPAFTIGLAAWLATIEGMRLATGNTVYRRVFDFWLKVFALSFGMGVVSGIVMAFQFGTNWSVLAERTGPIQGPLLGYEAFTAFMLEATFFGVMLLGRERAPPWFYFVSCCMVSLGTMLSSFWILANNSWMQVPIGHALIDGRLVPDDWWAIITGPVMRVRWPHMLLAAFLTTGMSVVATGAWYLLRRRTSVRGAGDAGLGPGARRGDHPGAAGVRASHRRLRPPLPARQVRRDRGALAHRAAGERGADRHSRRGGASATCSRSRCRSSAASSPRAPGIRARSGSTPSRRRTARRC